MNGINWRCWFGLHRWSKWGAVSQIVFGSVTGYRCLADGQERTCDDCGRIARRVVR